MKKKVEVLNVLFSSETKEWTIAFLLPKGMGGVLIVPVIEPDARAFIQELSLKETHTRTGSVWG